MRMFITSKNKYLSNDMKIFGTCSIPLTCNCWVRCACCQQVSTCRVTRAYYDLMVTLPLPPNVLIENDSENPCHLTKKHTIFPNVVIANDSENPSFNKKNIQYFCVNFVQYHTNISILFCNFFKNLGMPNKNKYKENLFLKYSVLFTSFKKQQKILF